MTLSKRLELRNDVNSSHDFFELPINHINHKQTINAFSCGLYIDHHHHFDLMTAFRSFVKKKKKTCLPVLGNTCAKFDETDIEHGPFYIDD